MGQELSPAQQQELFALLQGELRRARDAALADGVSESALAETIDERRRLLQSEDPAAGHGAVDDG